MPSDNFTKEAVDKLFKCCSGGLLSPYHHHLIIELFDVTKMAISYRCQTQFHIEVLFGLLQFLKFLISNRVRLG